MKKKVDLLYEDESYKIRGAAFTVYKQLGFSHKEIIYQKALAEALKSSCRCFFW